LVATEIVAKSVVSRKFELVELIDLNSIFKTMVLDAKASTSYTITRKTFDGAAGAQSSVAVTIAPRQQDQTGVFDFFESTLIINRGVADALTVGSGLDQRWNPLERTFFTITKFFGDDTAIPLDLVGVFDGLTYSYFARETDAFTIGLPNVRRVSDSDIERVSFTIDKSAKLGVVRTIAGWGTTVAGGTSSGDYIVIGDPSISPAGTQSRRSGATLENVSHRTVKSSSTIEPFGTNLLTYSEDLLTVLGTYPVSNFNAALLGFNDNYFVAPDRTVTADRIETTSASSYLRYNITLQPATTYTWSFYALKTQAAGTSNLAIQDIASSNFIVPITDYQPQLALSSWTRIVRTFTTDGPDVSLYFAIGTSNSIGIWGWQLELGTGAGNYVRTTATAIVASGRSVTIDHNTAFTDDRLTRVVPFRRLFQEQQDAFDNIFKDVTLPRAGVDTQSVQDEAQLAKITRSSFQEILGDLDPFGTVALVDRGTVRMTNYADIEYFAEDYIGESRILGNFYRVPTKRDLEDLLLITDEVQVTPGRVIGIIDPVGDLDPLNNINTLISRGSLRITNYVEEIDYFESDYVGESRIIS
jgi:hypothetical protein